MYFKHGSKPALGAEAQAGNLCWVKSETGLPAAVLKAADKGLVECCRRALLLLAAVGFAVPAPALLAGQLALSVVDTVGRYPPYQDYCDRYPGECLLEGAPVLAARPDLMRLLQQTNRDVNDSIEFALDIDQYGVEDFWARPDSGRGDCEDLALEKRSRLANAGLHRAAMRLAFVYHRVSLTAHCVLTIETSSGTFLLDSETDEIVRWDLTDYDFEARERTDGRWDRFDQTRWGSGLRR